MAEDAILSPTPADNPAKAALRRAMRDRRQALAAPARMAAAEAVAQHAATLPALATPGYVAGYWASAGELPLHVLQLRLREGQVWCLPIVQTDGSLMFAPWLPGDPLVPNRYGIPEPDVAPSSQIEPRDLSVVLLPLLGFTDAGARLGQGGGYYDRSFAFRQHGAPPPPHLVGIGYAFQRLDRLDADPWDIHLDAVVTEQGAQPCAR